MRDSLAQRIEFTLRPPCPSPSPSQHDSGFLDCSTTSSDTSMVLEEQERAASHRQPPPLLPKPPKRTVQPIVQESFEEDKEEEELPPAPLVFEPQDTSTPHTTPRKSFSRELPGATPNYTAESDDEDAYDTMMSDEMSAMTVEKRSDLVAPDGDLITTAKVLNAHADFSGWLWRKENMFRANSRFWALVFRARLYLYTEPKDIKETECIQLAGTVLRRHKKGKGFVLVVGGECQGRGREHKFQTVNSEQADEWIGHLQAAVKKGSKSSVAQPAEMVQPQERRTQQFAAASKDSFSSDDDGQTKAPSRPGSFLSSEGSDDQYETVEVSRVASTCQPQPASQEYDVPRISKFIPAPREAASSARRATSPCPRTATLPLSATRTQQPHGSPAGKGRAPLAPLASRSASIRDVSRRLEAQFSREEDELRPYGGRTGQLAATMTMGRQRTRPQEEPMRARAQSHRPAPALYSELQDRLKEGGRPLVPVRPSNLTLEPSGCPPYSRVEREGGRPALPGKGGHPAPPDTGGRPAPPGTLPRPGTSLHQPRASFLHQMVQSSEAEEDILGGGQAKGW